jgi:hypothetical protein
VTATAGLNHVSVIAPVMRRFRAERMRLFAALFDLTHGTAPKYAGKDMVNPGSLILSGEMMFRYLGWDEADDRPDTVSPRSSSPRSMTEGWDCLFEQRQRSLHDLGDPPQQRYPHERPRDDQPADGTPIDAHDAASALTPDGWGFTPATSVPK